MIRNILICDFSKYFSETFGAAVRTASQSATAVNVVHVIDLSVAVDAKILPPNCTEWHILQSLREQAEKEFSLLNKRLNPAAWPVVFEVFFGTSR